MANYLREEDMNTGEYISRDEALRALQQYCTDCVISCDGVMCRACDHANAMDIISDMPAAKIQPVKRGHWIYKGAVNGWDEIVCSNCDAVFSTQDREQIFDWEFCPHCSADMRDEVNKFVGDK